MPIEIKVAPPGITISQGRTFMVTNTAGEIYPSTDEGVFAVDTRFISYYQLFINREPWALINSSQLTFYMKGKRRKIQSRLEMKPMMPL